MLVLIPTMDERSNKVYVVRQTILIMRKPSR